MSTQFKDGTFSETKPYIEALSDFQDYAEAEVAKAFHVGTVSELEAVNKQVSVEERLEILERKVADSMTQNNPSSLIHTPTKDEISKYGA